jgi:CRP/FNR family transcriptional regulator, polysaccharide utilization system transcription regulator
MIRRTLEQPDCAQCSSLNKSVFCDLHGGDLEQLNADKGCVYYKKGQIIFNAGAYPHGLFCVKEGKIKVFQIGDEGKEQIVRLVKSGDIMGYRALLSGDKYSASAEVLEDARICHIPRSTFLGLLQQNGNLSMQLMKLLSNDLGVAEHRITELAQKPVRERVAEALLYMKETYGYESDGATIGVVLSREDIANIVGTATETVIRLLSEFKTDGVIRLDGKKIAILNQKQLVRLANVPE